METEKSSTAAADEIADDEEKKMDKFYELIRRFKEARDDHQRTLLQLRLHNHSNQREYQGVINPNNHNYNNNKKKNQMKKSEIKGVGSDTHATWMPSFKWEDFSDAHHHHHHLHQGDQDQDQDQNQKQVVFSGKSGPNFLHHASNCVNCIMDNNNVKKKLDFNFKKRKINDVADDDDDDDDDDDEITTADQLKKQRSHRFDTGLDLNLAL